MVRSLLLAIRRRNIDLSKVEIKLMYSDLHLLAK